MVCIQPPPLPLEFFYLVLITIHRSLIKRNTKKNGRGNPNQLLPAGGWAAVPPLPFDEASVHPAPLIN